MPNKFLTTQCSIRKTGLNSRICYSLSSAVQGDSPLWTKHMQCFGEPLLIYFTRMLEFQAPTHRVGACEFVSLAIGRDVSAA